MLRITTTNLLNVQKLLKLLCEPIKATKAQKSRHAVKGLVSRSKAAERLPVRSFSRSRR